MFKYLSFILLMLLSANAMATPIAGTVVAAAITTGDTANTFPSILGNEGYCVTQYVSNITALNAISSNLLCTGETALVTGSGVWYQWDGAMWNVYAGFGGGITLQTDGTNNSSQSVLNLVSGDSFSFTDNGSGAIEGDVVAGGYSGSVQFRDASTGSLFGVPALIYDESNERLGINPSANSGNLTAPRVTLDVQGTTSVSAFDGNVGIGTFVPAAKLDVQGTVKALFFKGNGSQLTNVPNIYNTDGTISGLTFNPRTVGIGTSYGLLFSSPHTSFAMSEQFGNPVITLGSTNTSNGNSSLIQMDQGGLDFEVDASGGGTSGLSYGNTGFGQFTDTTNNAGISYDLDYHVNGIADNGSRWIPDAGYVNNQILVAVPSQAGNSGKILTTNGTSTNWGNGSSLWVNNTGNVGINTTYGVGLGTTAQSSALNVYGGIGIGTTVNSSYLTTATSPGGINVEGNIGIGVKNPTNPLYVYTKFGFEAQNIVIDGADDPGVAMASNGVVKGYSPFIVTGAGDYITDSQPGDMGFRSESHNILWGVGPFNSTMAVVAKNVGIGTVFPIQALDVQGTIRSTALSPNSSVCTDGTSGLTTSGCSGGGGGSGNVGIGTTGNPAYYASNGSTVSPFINVNYVGANVGIGSTLPGQKLDVQGTVRTTNFTMPTGAASGDIFTSDGSGNASWALNSRVICSSGTFTNSSLSAGVLTITHNFNLTAPYMVNAAIFNNNNLQILPDNITGATNTAAVDLTSFGTLSGTWGYAICNGAGVARADLRTITFAFNNGGSVVPTGTILAQSVSQISGTIVGYYLTGQPSGSIQLDVWKANGAIPTVANTIVASAPPTLSSSQYLHSSTLTGWTVSVATGDVLMCSVTSASTTTEFELQLIIQPN